MGFEETYETGQKNIKIVKFTKRNNLYLYIYDSDTRKVSYTSLGSPDIDYCKSNWFKSYEKFVKKGGSPTKVKKTSLKTKYKEFIDHQLGRVDRNEIKESTFKTVWERMRNRIHPYIEQSGVKTVQDITRKSFQDFSVYWKSKGKDIGTINNDINTFNLFLTWLCNEEILDINKRPKLKKLKQVKDFKKDVNPPFTGKDWEIFKETLYRYETSEGDEQDDLEKYEKWWFRKNFVNWVFFQMLSGNRPSESSKLTYGDVRVDEHKLPNGVTTLRGIVEISRDTKTGKRTMVMNGTSIRRIFEHFHYSKHPKWLSFEITDDTPLFVNPYTNKSVHQESFRQHYKKCLEFSGLVDKGYTLYSLRSTHITKLLLEGSSVEDISRNLGNSPEVIRRHYDGVENILKSDELLKLNRHYFQDRL
jgi:site-specific recombinase XerD|tara:strand:- start:1506 stop:2756 length:1251 start_codon:yes stop_codon:yes gene_type:complete